MSKKGFTIIELLVVLAILALIAVVILWSLLNFRSRQAVKNTRSEIVSALSLARSRSLNGLDDKVHGVNFSSSHMTIFSGATFTPAAAGNQIYNFPLVTLTLNLAGGESVVFDRLTGATNNFGAININSISGSNTATVTVITTGLIADQ